MPVSHRVQFQEELGRLETQALGALDLVVVTLDRTLEALHHRLRGTQAATVAVDQEADRRQP